MQIDLSGKAILVTGASRGIGQAVATTLAQCGATVAIHYHSQQETAEALAQSLGQGARAFQANLAQPSEVAHLFDTVVDTLGPLHGIVNNAGIALSTPLDTEGEAWLETWQRTLAVNTTAVGILCKKAVAHFIDQGGGRIVNIASRASFRGDTPEYLAYAASKAGVVAITRSLARNFGKQNIKAFDIAPGFTRTDMAQDFMEEYGEDYALNDIALGQLTEPQDIAPTVAFLLSGLADHATGTTIHINAGSYVH